LELGLFLTEVPRVIQSSFPRSLKADRGQTDTHLESAILTTKIFELENNPAWRKSNGVRMLAEQKIFDQG